MAERAEKAKLAEEAMRDKQRVVRIDLDKSRSDAAGLSKVNLQRMINQRVACSTAAE